MAQHPLLRSTRGLLLLGATLALAGCDEGRGRPPSGTTGPSPRDGGAADTGSAGHEDAAFTADAEPNDDAGAADAAPRDAAPADTGATDAGPPDAGSPDAGSPDAGSPDAGPSARYCRRACSTPADCVQGNSPTLDADNWTCTGGTCTYLGCLNDGECSSTFGANYACGATYPSGLPGCVQRCVVATDCALASELYDADNYRCNTGRCEWTGCNTSAECNAALSGGASYACELVPALGFRNCNPICNTPQDCGSGSPAFSAAHYTCTQQRCTYLGCRTDQECRDTFSDPAQVCR